MIEDIKKIVNEQFVVGTRVVNCAAHMNRKLTGRPPDCTLCRVDIENHLGLALRANEFMNSQLDRIKALLKESTT